MLRLRVPLRVSYDVRASRLIPDCSPHLMRACSPKSSRSRISPSSLSLSRLSSLRPRPRHRHRHRHRRRHRLRLRLGHRYRLRPRTCLRLRSRSHRFLLGSSPLLFLPPQQDSPGRPSLHQSSPRPIIPSSPTPFPPAPYRRSSRHSRQDRRSFPSQTSPRETLGRLTLRRRRNTSRLQER